MHLLSDLWTGNDKFGMSSVCVIIHTWLVEHDIGMVRT